MAEEDQPGEHTVACHLFVSENGGGHVYPDTQANREMGRKTKVTLTEAQAARYGGDVKRLDRAKDAEVTHNKQVTNTRTK